MDESGDTLRALHRIAVHVLGRRRCQVSGRFGLRASPGSVATPAFGDEPEVIRLTGSHLIRERAATCSALALQGSTLRELADFAGADLGAVFSCGQDTPEVGDIDTPLALEPVRLFAILDWYELGARVLDGVVSTVSPGANPSTVQLWPEHMDVATSVGVPDRARANLGFSPGDSFDPHPYVYVGPWEESRPGDPSYWNAPFGAILRAEKLNGDDAARADTCVEFLLDGLHRLATIGDEGTDQ